MHVSLTKIKKVLSDCAFDPRKDSLMRPVVENVANYPDYAVMKAIELLREHQQQSPRVGAITEGTDFEIVDGQLRYQAMLDGKLEQAIQLLALRLAQ